VSLGAGVIVGAGDVVGDTVDGQDVGAYDAFR
jgi:hypothetical protein